MLADFLMVTGSAGVYSGGGVSERSSSMNGALRLSAAEGDGGGGKRAGVVGVRL